MSMVVDTPAKAVEHQVFVFRVSLERSIYRDIAISPTQTLYQFASAIVSAFDFEFDHPFGFYNHLKDPYQSTMGYELFIDLDPKSGIPGYKGVKKTKINTLFTAPKDQWLFLFDYGDDWIFKVQLRDIMTQAVPLKRSKVVLSKGDAPPQYPDYDDEDEDEVEDNDE